MNNKTNTLVSAAIAGVMTAALAGPAFAASPGKCFNANDCKGHSDCKSAKNNSCAGQNGCGGKDQGWKKMTKADCMAAAKASPDKKIHFAKLSKAEMNAAAPETSTQ
jgi:uncharacterized membrane protein